MFWIKAPGPGRIGIAARPRAGDWLEDEVEQWRNAQVDIVVSLLEPHEVHDLELEPERDTCIKVGLTFLSFPIQDRGTPTSLAKTRELVTSCKDRMARGNSIIIHCRAGIGRSSLIAACVLVALGNRADEAFEHIATAGGLPVLDTPAQVEWVTMFTLT